MTRMFRSFNLASVSAPTAAAARVSLSFSMSSVFHAPSKGKREERRERRRTRMNNSGTSKKKRQLLQRYSK